MQRSVLALFLLFALALCPATGLGAPQPPDSGPAPDMRVSSKADPCVRLRSGAALSRSVVDCLEAGTRLRLLGSISGWSHVRLLDGTEGWIDSTFLEPAPILSSAEPPAAQPAANRPDAAQPATPPSVSPDVLADLQGQIAALEGQLEAMAARREATEGRLRRTVEAAEAAQTEASQLRQRLGELEREAAGSERPARLDGEIEGLRARIAELETALADAESRLLRAAALNAEQERRIEALDGAVAAGRSREAER